MGNSERGSSESKHFPVLGRFFGPIFKFLFVFSLIAIMVIVIFFSADLLGKEQGQAGGAELIYYETGEVVQDTDVGQASTNILGNIWELLTDPAAATTEYGFESEVEDYSAISEGIGVKVDNFEQISEPLEGEPIELSGTIRAAGIEDNLEVVAFCSLDKPSGQIPANTKIPASIYATETSGQKALFYKDTLEQMEVSCIFPGGIYTNASFGAAAAKLNVQYEFVTKAMHKVYLLHSDNLKALKSSARDPFEYYGIIDPLLQSDNTVKSKTTPGPINLGIGTYSSQPFREMQPYTVGVELDPGLIGGNIYSIDYLHLHVPPNFAMATDTFYQSTTKDVDALTCDFQYTGMTDVYGFNIYDLKQEIKDKINTNCDASALKFYQDFSEEDCIETFKEDIIARCKFMVLELPPEETLYATYFRSETKYNHEITSVETVVVRKLPQTSLSTGKKETDILSILNPT